mmetsp:Transcript_5476/g.19396  ORF Transcript_5476/g.19396 Transcript_5476/m.19396 type:complete len:284 (-) Transcript_5476:490-1341(-)
MQYRTVNRTVHLESLRSAFGALSKKGPMTGTPKKMPQKLERTLKIKLRTFWVLFEAPDCSCRYCKTRTKSCIAVSTSVLYKITMSMCRDTSQKRPDGPETDASTSTEQSAPAGVLRPVRCFSTAASPSAAAGTAAASHSSTVRRSASSTSQRSASGTASSASREAQSSTSAASHSSTPPASASFAPSAPAGGHGAVCFMSKSCSLVFPWRDWFETNKKSPRFHLPLVNDSTRSPTAYFCQGWMKSHDTAARISSIPAMPENAAESEAKTGTTAARTVKTNVLM